MKTVLIIILLLMLMQPCIAEDAPYFEKHGIEIDYVPGIDLNIKNYGCVLEYPESDHPSAAGSILPRPSYVRFDILKDEVTGDIRNIEVGMTVNELEKIWPSGPMPNNSLVAFGAYDYYTGTQIDIGTNGLSSLVFTADMQEDIFCNEMHTTKLSDGTEIQACVRWGKWHIDDEWNPVFSCIFSFSVPADYDGIVIGCLRHGRGDEYLEFIMNGMPELDDMGEYLHDSMFMRVQ